MRVSSRIVLLFDVTRRFDIRSGRWRWSFGWAVSFSFRVMQLLTLHLMFSSESVLVSHGVIWEFVPHVISVFALVGSSVSLF